MLKVENLRCEYKKNPIGIDVLKPRFSWVIESDGIGVLQNAFQVQVAIDESFTSEFVWDSGKVELDNSVHIIYEGSVLRSKTRYFYRVKVWDNHGNTSDWSNTAIWEMSILDKKEWVAEFITSSIEVNPKEYSPCPMFRKEFSVIGDIKSARIYTTALGLYELRLNGCKVGDELLTPGWTSYKNRLQYQTYDVTEQLKNGENAMGAVVGDGWYKGDLASWQGYRNFYGTKSSIFIQMHIIYNNGNEQTLSTDDTWKTSTGPILMSEIYHGEKYDSRLEVSGWDKAGFNDSDWKAVKKLDIPKSILTAQENVPVRKMNIIEPIELIKTPFSENIIDMGQNMVGWVKIKVKGQKGDRVLLKHAEILDKDGNFYTENLRAAKQAIEYILKGEGEEIFEPHFTFQGFRYIKVEEYPGEIQLKNFEGIVIHSDMESTSKFECSNEMLNQLQHNILWGQKGNFVDVPTDCPQRDERLGWTGDAQAFIRTACFNMNTVVFFEKWLKDLEADQLENGGVPFVIPHVLNEKDHSSSGWGDAAVICPWTIYQCYGDIRVLEEQYDSMKNWIRYIKDNSQDGLLWNTGFHCGDWLGLDAKEGSYFGATANDLISTAFYAYSTSIVAKTAKILKNEADFIEYSDLYLRIINEFRKEFYTPNGRLSVPTQTAHVLVLMFDLVDEKDRKRTAETLAKMIEENKFHLTTGFLGTPYICDVLHKNGYTDIAYKLLLQTEYPSWLYPISKGATTIWEHWDGIKPDGSLWSADMNSFNHYAYGAIGHFMYSVVAGIDIDESKPGYKHILISPQYSHELEYASAELESMYGTIKSGWRNNDGKMEVEIVIPHNTTASVKLPGAKSEVILDNLKKSGQSIDISRVRESIDGVCIELGSGRYDFTY